LIGREKRKPWGGTKSSGDRGKKITIAEKEKRGAGD